MLIEGRCHCGNIAFTLDWEETSDGIPARACTCSFCTKHGGLWTSNPNARLDVRVSDARLVSRYRFGTRTATFHVCACCGGVPFVTSVIDDRVYAVVNVNAFENVPPAVLRRASASFDDETVDGRLARRQRNWIGDVRITAQEGA
jgi:hypothetical protein